MDWVGHVACMKAVRSLSEVLFGSPKRQGCLGDLGLCGSIGKEWTLSKEGMEGYGLD
jgi:hypothetical protein